MVELNELQGKSEEQQNKINNSEKLGTSGARLEARRSKVSRATFKDKKITFKGCESVGVLQEASWKVGELEDAKSEAESKRREYVALVDERECSTRELKNAEDDIRKLRSGVKTEQTSKKVIQRKLEAINAQSPFSRPPNLYELLFLTQGQQPQQSWKIQNVFFAGVRSVYEYGIKIQRNI